MVFRNLKESRQKQLIGWIHDCSNYKITPQPSKKIIGLIGFILKFRSTNFRAILTKKRNKYFIALYLDKHKYYETERKKLGI